MYRYEWKVIGRGKAGWHAEGLCDTGTVSSSGGGRDDEQLTKYLAQAVDGALVYDASGADDAAFTRFVLHGPMVDVRLQPEAEDRFSAADREAARFMMPALGGAFKTYAALAQRPGYSGLDSVGVGIYRRLLAAIPGIKIGTVHNGAIVWDTAAADQPTV